MMNKKLELECDIEDKRQGLEKPGRQVFSANKC
jgi:hypothetical protein